MLGLKLIYVSKRGPRYFTMMSCSDTFHKWLMPSNKRHQCHPRTIETRCCVAGNYYHRFFKPSFDHLYSQPKILQKDHNATVITSIGAKIISMRYTISKWEDYIPTQNSIQNTTYFTLSVGLVMLSYLKYKR